MPHKTAQYYIMVVALSIALGMHIAALAIIGVQQGWTTLLVVPFTVVEASVALIALIRYFLSEIRNCVLKDKNADFGCKYFMACITFPGGMAAEAMYFLALGCVIFRVLIFNESSDCLLDTCAPSTVQKYISLVASVILWGVAEERKPEKAKKRKGKRAGKPSKPDKKSELRIPVVDAVPASDVVLDLSGTKSFGFRRRLPGKLRLV